MAFVLDANIRIAEILGLGKLEAALSKVKGVAQVGAAVGVSVGATAGGAGAMASSLKAQAVAATASAAAMNKTTLAANKLNTALSQTSRKVGKAKSSIDKASKSAKGFGDSIRIAGVRYAAFLAATVAPFAALAGLAKATAAVIEFDTAMLKVRQILGQTEQQISGLRDTILNFATATGTSASELARVSKVLSQAGFRGKELEESLSALAKVPLTPSFETMDAAIEGTIAALKQFNEEGLTTTDILDVMTALSNKFAASSEDIAKGISRGGAAFEAIGGTFKEFAAIFTTIRQATRESAETVGTFMKTISSRLADPKIVAFLEGKGIRIAEAIEAGNPVEAIKRIATAMQNLTSIQEKVEIGTKIAGRRQISRLFALVNSIDVLDDALLTAGTSAGEFGKIAEEGLKGVQAQINIMIQEWNKLVQTLADPLFLPVIKAVTAAGKALAAIVSFASPIIPMFTAIVGFSIAFKLLSLSIHGTTKALALMGTVGRTIGGGLGALTGAIGVGAGGAAGTTARERLRSRMGMGVGQAAAVGGIGARVASGSKKALKGLAGSQLGQLAIVAGLILAADKLSTSFEESGNSAGVFSTELVKAAGAIAAGMIILSGKALPAFFHSLGAIGGPITAVIAGLAALTYASNKAAEMDMNKAVDEVVKKVSEIKIKPIETGDTESLKEAIGIIGNSALEGIEGAAKAYEDDFFDVFGRLGNRLKNFFTGKGSITINDAEAQAIIDKIVGKNPQILNEILRAAVEQFGAGGLERGLDQLLSELPKVSDEAAVLFRTSMVKALGGIDKIAAGISESKITAEVSKLSNSIAKAAADFRKLHVPVTLTSQLSLLSDAIGRTVKAIDNNVSLFSRLSQQVGQGVGAIKLEGNIPTEKVEQIVREGKLPQFLDTSQIKGLSDFAEDVGQLGHGFEDFMKSIIASKEHADSLTSLLKDPTVDPFDVFEPFIQEFMKQFSDDLPPEVVDVFRSTAANLAGQIRDLLIDGPGILPDSDMIKEALESALEGQQPFHEATISIIKKWIDAQTKANNAAIDAIVLRAVGDLDTAKLADTLVNSFLESLRSVEGLSEKLGGIPEGNLQGLREGNEAMISISQNTAAARVILDSFSESMKKQGEIAREAIENGNTIELSKQARESAVNVSSLGKALQQLVDITQQAPQALAAQQKEQRKFDPEGFDEESATREMEALMKHTNRLVQDIVRERRKIEIESAIDISRILSSTTETLATAFRDASEAVKIFTSALTKADVQSGLGILQPTVGPGGRVGTERVPIPEARPEREAKTEKRHLQSALFGGDIKSVMETLLESAAQVAEGKVLGRISEGKLIEAAAISKLADNFRDFTGLISDIPKFISDTGIDTKEVAGIAADMLRERAEDPRIPQVEKIGALPEFRTQADLSESLDALLKNPSLLQEPQGGVSMLEQNTKVLQLLENLSKPIAQISPAMEDAPRVFEEVSSMRQTAADFRTATDATMVSTTETKEASANMTSGGENILTASNNMTEAIGQLQSIVDTQREALVGPQATTAIGAVEDGSVEVMSETTNAVNALGEKMDAVGQAIQSQTEQEAARAVDEKEKPVKIEGLEDNTDAVSTNSEVISGTNESMSELNEGMVKVAGAMEDGIGIDIETMSHIKIDLQGISEAAGEFTAEFEAVATRVAKEQINLVLQELARNASNTEAASTFESAIS